MCLQLSLSIWRSSNNAPGACFVSGKRFLKNVYLAETLAASDIAYAAAFYAIVLLCCLMLSFWVKKKQAKAITKRGHPGRFIVQWLNCILNLSCREQYKRAINVNAGSSGLPSTKSAIESHKKVETVCNEAGRLSRWSRQLSLQRRGGPGFSSP